MLSKTAWISGSAAVMLGLALWFVHITNLNSGLGNVAFVTQSVDETPSVAVQAEPELICTMQAEIQNNTVVVSTLVQYPWAETQLLPGYTYFEKGRATSETNVYDLAIDETGNWSLIDAKSWLYTVNGMVKNPEGVLISCASATVQVP